MASRVLIDKQSGPTTLNFDFIGTFYDFETAIDNKDDSNVNDNYNTVSISDYWVRDTSGALL